MKLVVHDGVISLAVENETERRQCEAVMALQGHAFELFAKTDRGFAFKDLGEKPDACREPLNIGYRVEPRFAPISNFAHTPFELDGLAFASVESFWQGLKFEDPDTRRRIAMLHGYEAKRAGSEGRPERIAFGGRIVQVGSPEHWDLMTQACRAKFSTNAVAKAALLATGQRTLTHKMRNDSRTIPGVVMSDIWMRIREDLREGSHGDVAHPRGDQAPSS